MKFDAKTLLRISTASPFNIFRFSSRMHILPSLCIYLTNFCNYDCIMCDSRRSVKKVREYIKIETLERLISDCSTFRVKPRLHFSGLGEPLVYPKVNLVMELCKRNKLQWSITTNGLLLEKYAKYLIEYGCKGINLSVHGEEDLHNIIVGTPNAYQTVLTAVNVLDIEKRKLKSKHPRVAINCVITNENALRLREIYNCLKNWPINSITFQHVSFSKEDFLKKVPFVITEKEKLEYLIDFVDSIKNENKSVPVFFYPSMNIDFIKDYHTNLLFPTKVHCFLPWLSLRVYPNGQVKMCEETFGNIENQSIRQIMNNDHALSFRKSVLQGKFNKKVCFRCCHRLYE